MINGFAHNGSVSLAYEQLDGGGEPLLLIMGLGMQMIFWPDEFCSMLAGRGFSVARFDNRDVGQSTHFTAIGAPRLARLLHGPRTSAPYRLEDMADDAVAVLDALGWPTAHIVGASLGGMIAQTVAIRHPHRVRSLTSIISTPSLGDVRGAVGSGRGRNRPGERPPAVYAGRPRAGCGATAGNGLSTGLGLVRRRREVGASALGGVIARR